MTRPFSILETAYLISQANEFGPLHIIIADENVDDEHLQSCRVPELDDLEIKILDLLDQMTTDQRIAAVLVAEEIEDFQLPLPKRSHEKQKDKD